MLYSPILSFLRIFPLTIWTIFCSFMQLIFFSLGKEKFFIFYRLFFKGLTKIFGIKIICKGNIE
ncbi:MAG: hypothetical protein CFH30_01155, partial [Alphaproteobacteria bacterium MarineAlpha8_Bin1]